MFAVHATTPAQRTANAARLMRAIAGSKRRKMPRKLWPRADERVLAEAIRALTIRAVAPSLVEVLRGLPPIIDRARANARVDELHATRADVGEARDLIARAYKSAIDRISVDEITAIATRVAHRVSAFGRAQLARQVKAALGADVPIPDATEQAVIATSVDHTISVVLDNIERLFGNVDKDVARALAAPRIDSASRVDADVRSVENALLVVRRPTDFDADALADAVEANVSRGGTNALLARELSDRFGFARDHAAFIARDQVGSLNGRLDADRQRQLGVRRFIWRTVGDERVREEHEERDGETYEWDDPPDGELPGTPINCVPGFARVSLHAPTRKAYRRWHRGELTELVTDSGKSMYCTPNHPVLTSRGWLPAHLVEVGDNVVETPAQRIDGLVADPERGDATAEEVFRALSLVGVVHRIRGGTPWFHGDGADQDIEVVEVDRLLLLDVMAERLESLDQEEFAIAAKSSLGLGHTTPSLVALADASNGIVRGLRESGALAGSRSPHALEHRRAAIAWLDSVRQQHATNNGPGNVQSLGDCLLADAALVCADHLVFRKVDAIVRRTWEGFVYNFSTSTGWFGSHGLIIHNCRCSAEPILDDIFEDLEGESPTPSQPDDEPEPDRDIEPVSTSDAPRFVDRIASAPITATESKALFDYQGGRYIDINAFARAGGKKLPEGSAFRTRAEAQATMKAIDSAIRKGKTPRDALVYRGVKWESALREGVTGKLEVGSTIHDKGFTSTSLDRKVAEEFGATLFEIELPRGSRAAFVAVDGSLKESEILLPRGTKFEVLAVSNRGGKTVVRLRPR